MVVAQLGLGWTRLGRAGPGWAAPGLSYTVASMETMRVTHSLMGENEEGNEMVGHEVWLLAVSQGTRPPGPL